MLVLTFNEVGLHGMMHTFNGLSARDARAEIINHVANRVTLSNYGHPDVSIEYLYDWKNAIVNFVLHKIEIPAMPYDIWVAVMT